MITPDSPDILTGTIGDCMFTIAEIAKHCKLHPDTVRKLFHSEPGVVVIANKSTSKRQYRTYRVPASVVTRVIARLSVQGVDHAA